jgi:hypothetical protein
MFDLACVEDPRNNCTKIVAPKSKTDMSTGTGALTGIPFGWTTTFRYQAIYNFDEHNNLGTSSWTVNELCVREGKGAEVVDAQLPAIRIKLSNTTAAPDSLSTTYANNVKTTEVTFFEGSATWSSSAGTDPTVFDLCFVANGNQDFTFKPSEENILMEVQMFQGSSLLLFLEADTEHDGLWSTDSAAAPEGSINPRNPVTKFDMCETDTDPDPDSCTYFVNPKMFTDQDSTFPSQPFPFSATEPFRYQTIHGFDEYAFNNNPYAYMNVQELCFREADGAWIVVC